MTDSCVQSCGQPAELLSQSIPLQIKRTASRLLRAAVPFNVLFLTRELLLQDTINPPGNEDRCVAICAGFLESIGFSVNIHSFEPHRDSLVARLPGGSERKPICFTGHVDTVPLGIEPWTRSPFNGEQAGDRLYGRGSTDMKGGVAAMLCMAKTLAALPHRRAGLTLVLTAGEEVCNDGAAYLARCSGALGDAGALVVGEPSSNYPWIGHKGCVRMKLITQGRSAHASRPELGENAVIKAAEVILKLQHFDFGVPPHPMFGAPTLNIGNIHGGLNVNSVPDRATIGIDMRIPPDYSPVELQRRLQAHLGDEVVIDTVEQAIGIESSADSEWIQRVYEKVRTITGVSPAPAVAPYFTDASILTPAYGNPPTVILGPGDLEQAHTTDESCSVRRLEEAVHLYTDIARDWCLG